MMKNKVAVKNNFPQTTLEKTEKLSQTTAHMSLSARPVARF